MHLSFRKAADKKPETYDSGIGADGSGAGVLSTRYYLPPASTGTFLSFRVAIQGLGYEYLAVQDYGFRNDNCDETKFISAPPTQS